MKIKLLILGLGLGASILAGCNDDFSSIGTRIHSIVRVIFNLSIHLMREKLIRWNSIYIIMVPIKTVYG